MSGLRNAGLRDRESGPVHPEMVIQAEVGGMTLAFTELVNGSEADLKARFDIYRRVIDHARAYQLLYEALNEVASREKTLHDLPKRRDAAMKAIAEERARARASFAGGARTGNLTGQQQKTMDMFNKQLEDEQAKWDKLRAQLEIEIPLYMDQVARQRAVIEGAERADSIGFDLPEAAE